MRKSKAWRSAAKAMDALVASLPKLDCQGLCQASCGRIEECLTPFEADRIAKFMTEDEDWGGAALVGLEDCTTCPLLTKSGRCSVHAVKPIICRLWGLVNDQMMRCHFGCVPSPRYLTNEEAKRIFNRMREISRRYQEESQSSAKLAQLVEEEQP